MDKNNNIKSLLGENTLPSEVMESLQEAFDKRVAAERLAAEETIREEMARRFEADKASLVEAMDLMMTDVATKHASRMDEENQKLIAARKAFREAKKDMQVAFKKRIAEQSEASREFVSEAVKKEVLALREQKKSLVSERLRVAESLEEQRSKLVADYGQRVKKIEEFIVRHVNMEMAELAQDQKALVEARVKLIAEGRKKLKETQDRFIAEAAKKVDRFVTETLNREVSQLHEDLERNRQNMFGRRIFEAVAAEFMTSYLAEGTEIGKRNKVIEGLKTENAEVKRKLDEAARIADQAARKAKLAEDRAARANVMGELLSNLRGEKRAVMEGLMETVKTENLRETFNKLLPSVLSESGRKVATTTNVAPRKALVESRAAVKPSVVVTGDATRANRLFETARSETDDLDSDLQNLIRLAGMK